MSYTPLEWKDGPQGGTPITAAALNRMEQGIADAHAIIGSLQAGTAFAYYLTPPDVSFSSDNVEYDPWWVQDVTKSVVVRILLPGTIRYRVEYRNDSLFFTTFVRILLNGSQIREEGTVPGSWQTIIGNITVRSEEHTSELQSREKLVCRLSLE